MLKLAEPHVLSLEPYVPGRSIENNPNILRWAKLASNENCLGPSPMALEAVAASLKNAHLYPNAKRYEVSDKICEHLKQFSVQSEQVALGNGTSELIVNLVRGLLGAGESVLFPWPTFVMYRLAAEAHGRVVYAVPAKNDMSFDIEGMIELCNRAKTPVKLVFLANPNNPTGNYVNGDDLEYFVNSIPKDVVLVIDEAYFEYVVKDDYPNGLFYALSRPRTLVLRTLSKIYGLAGMRLGYAIGDPSIIDVVSRIADPFNVNGMAQYAAIAAFLDQTHVKKSVRHNQEIGPKLAIGLRKLGFFVHEGVGNFLMAKNTSLNTDDLCNKLLSQGVIIRPLNSFGLKDWVRISIGTHDEITQLFASLEAILKP